MIATNHYLVGVAIVVGLKNPILVLPAAFASHFVLDALPHFGLKYSTQRGKILLIGATLDTLLCIAAFVLTLHFYPTWYVLAGLVAITPDFAWVYRFTIKEKFGKLPPAPCSRFNDWHTNIQKFESPRGGMVEVAVAATLAAFLF